MIGNCLLTGIGISGVSTCVYAFVTHDAYDIRDRKEEYLKIFSIIVTISVFILYFTRSNTSIISHTMSSSGNTPMMGGGKPPF